MVSQRCLTEAFTFSVIMIDRNANHNIRLHVNVANMTITHSHHSDSYFMWGMSNSFYIMGQIGLTFFLNGPDHWNSSLSQSYIVQLCLHDRKCCCSRWENIFSMTLMLYKMFRIIWKVLVAYWPACSVLIKQKLLLIYKTCPFLL